MGRTRCLPSSVATLLEGARKGQVDLARIDATFAPFATTRVAVPNSPRRELFVRGGKAEASPIEEMSLLGGPALLRILGFRASTVDLAVGSGHNPVGAGVLLEVDRARVAERRDLFKHFFEHPARYEFLVASSDGTMLCYGEDPECVELDGGAVRAITPPETVIAIARVGGAHWLVTRSGGVVRSDGSAVPGAPNDVTGLVATSDHDVWAVRHGLVASRFDGSTWTETPVPRTIEILAARAPDDVWSNDGSLHWDGQQWSLVYGAPAASAAIAAGPNDVWLAGPGGVWRGSAPGITPVRVAVAASNDDGAAPPPATLTIDAPDAAYASERVRFTAPAEGGAPIERARRVAAAQDGTLWLDVADRIVEVAEDGTTTTLRARHVDSFARWFLPEGPRQGTSSRQGPLRGLAVGQTIERIGGSPLDARLPNHDLVALDGASDGAVWLVGRVQSTYSDPREADLAPHALFRPQDGASFVPVIGLPSAEWCDVATDADGGAWFAGALDRGPEGEGILFHARGRAGADGSTRVRAFATLLAVAAVGKAEGWAVGAAGTIVHVGSGGAVARYALATGEWLRAVAARGPDDVWIVGDGGTLIHFDGHAFRPVDHPLGARAALTSIAFARGAVFVASPSGIVRITRRS